ncbi:MAG: LLM class flavin-dependent oxidoreductase [Acidobacteria bacterium]|nr:LLM class flavin-dependent oxidoreductase [Acidobacteriota bacterium]
MHVGASFIFQNPGKQQPDHAVWNDELALVDLVEPLGFDSVWATEHHITDYIMCPDPVQFLAYAAARTTTARLGTMVVVLPWRDPFRVAEQIAMLDVMSGGRVIFGMGRGAGRCEFDGFRVPMEESRARFVEAAEMIMGGLESGFCEYDGDFYTQPRAAVRPRANLSFKGRTYAAAVSPESAEIMAKLGVGLLIIPQKPWDHVAKELAEYRALFQRVNGFDAPAPIAAGWTFVDESEERAYEILYQAWGFPELWVETPDEPSRSRPRRLRPGLTLYLLAEGRYRIAAESRAFPGWKAASIHASLNETRSARARSPS